MSPLERNRILTGPESVKRLAQRLSECPQVTRFDGVEHKEAWALAYSFSDLEGSFRAFLDEQLPSLAEGKLGPSEVYDLLLEVGEEFRHVLYHIIEYQKFYKYLVPEGTEVFGEPGQRE